MTESLDGGAVTYRSNRHFDILNENIVFPWQAATSTTAHRDIFETRRTSYGQGLVLLNNTSHDEAGYSDPWEAFIRYTVGNTLDGAPMIMYGQEIGTAANLSFDKYEVNFGKNIPHFKAWNSMQPQWSAWNSNTFGVKNLIPAYSGAGKAREFSPALRSSSRWFLNPTGTATADPNIFAVAKYEEANASPATRDVVLAFVNLKRSNSSANTFGIPSGLGALLGIKSGRTYNVRNIAAYLGPNNEYPDRRNKFLWGNNGLSGSSILSGGIYVSLAGVPTTDSAWGSSPFEAQYLKLYDITPPPAVNGTPTIQTPFSVLGASSQYTADGSTRVTWNAVADSEGLIPVYRVTAKDGSGNVVSTTETTATSVVVTGLPAGGNYTFSVTAVNPNDTSKAASTSGSSASVVSLNPSADDDGDGMPNASELIAGTSPQNSNSRFEIQSITTSANGVMLTWAAAPGRIYTLEAREDLEGGDWIPISPELTSGSFTDSSATSHHRFYRLNVR